MNIEYTNTGHGWIFPRPDGMKARCGGPALCPDCAHDAGVKYGVEAPHPPKPPLGPSQPQEYPYWAVKGVSGMIFPSTIRSYKESSIFNFQQIEAYSSPWVELEEQGYSLVRVAIVEEPK